MPVDGIGFADAEQSLGGARHRTHRERLVDDDEGIAGVRSAFGARLEDQPKPADAAYTRRRRVGLDDGPRAAMAAEPDVWRGRLALARRRYEPKCRASLFSDHRGSATLLASGSGRSRLQAGLAEAGRGHGLQAAVGLEKIEQGTLRVAGSRR